MALTFDFNSCDLGEIEEMEEASGYTFEQIVKLTNGSEDKPLPTKLLIAAVWITKRRDNPDYTLEDARKFKLADFSADDDTPPPAPPTDAGGS